MRSFYYNFHSFYSALVIPVRHTGRPFDWASTTPAEMMTARFKISKWLKSRSIRNTMRESEIVIWPFCTWKGTPIYPVRELHVHLLLRFMAQRLVPIRMYSSSGADLLAADRTDAERKFGKFNAFCRRLGSNVRRWKTIRCVTTSSVARFEQ